MNADRTPSDELYEVKKVHQEVSFYDDGQAKDGTVRIVNEFLNTNLNEYDISWKLLIDNGIKAIWNFAHIDLDAPEDVMVENVHLSESLMTLSYNLSEYRKEHEGM